MRHAGEDNFDMSSVTYMAERVIEREPTANGLRREQVIGAARRMGLAPGTIQNLVKGRLKFVERVEARVREAFIRMLEQEISKATHELEIARRISARLDSAAVLAAETAVVSAQKRVEELKAYSPDA